MRTYTVAELIKALQDLPQDLPVLDECCEGIDGMDIVQQVTCPWLPKDYIMLHTTTYDIMD